MEPFNSAYKSVFIFGGSVYCFLVHGMARRVVPEEDVECQGRQS